LSGRPFTRLSKAQVRRRWFPKITVTVLEPVKLTVALTLKGKYRRQAAGAALYEIMSDLVFRTTSTDSTVVDEVINTRLRRRPMSQRSTISTQASTFALAKVVKCSWCGNDRMPKGSYHASLSSPLRSRG